MKVIVPLALFIVLAVVGLSFWPARRLTQPEQNQDPTSSPASTATTKTVAIKVTSPDFLDGQTIPPKYSCDGQNTIPPLSLENIPAEAQSLALMVDDPDAPGGTFNHWLLWNLDAQTREIKEGETPPEAVFGTNDFGQTKYGGPCPPPGTTHRYRFQVYALDTTLDLAPGRPRADLENALKDHTLAQGILTGLYSR